MCLDAWTLCVHACVLGRQGPLMSQERALQRTRGRGDWGRVPGGGAGLAWLEEADWAGAWAGTSHMGLRDAMGMSACSWVLCLFLYDWVSRFVCPNVCLHVYAWKCLHVHTCPCPRLSTSMFYLCHVYVAPYFSFLCFICSSTCLNLAEFLNMSEACLWVCQCCCVFLWGVSVCPCMFLCVALWHPSS